jgi:type II secretion system protein I
MMTTAGRRTGFTLIEAVVALAVVSIALLGLLRLHLLSVASADRAQTLTAAVLLARARITEATCAGYPSVGVESGRTDTEGGEMTWRTQVTNVRPARRSAVREGLRRIAVEVAWGQGHARKQIEMTTYVAETRIDAK